MATPANHLDWFDQAVATPTDSRHINVDGCAIHYRVWPGAGDPAQRGIVFVHGSAAHSHWWDHIAPSFSSQYAVAALDLAGMGESDRRSRYTIEGFAGEIAAVIHDAGLDRPDRPKPVVIAHSFGAFATSHLALAQPNLLAGYVIIDSHLAVPEVLRIPVHTPFTAKARAYATREDALARFRLIPAQPNSMPHIQDHIARHSVRQTPAGWSWKFEGVQLSDDNVGAAMFLEMEGYLRNIHTPAALIYGELSTLVTPEIARHIATRFPLPIPLIEIPNGHHHLMLDQPLALIEALQMLLSRSDFLL